MASFSWEDRIDGVDANSADDINAVAHAVIDTIADGLKNTANITNNTKNIEQNKKAIETEITERKAANEELTYQLSGKVDKIEGKGLSSNDFTDELCTKYDTATLQAMYGEIIEPLPEEWFTYYVDETTNKAIITGMVEDEEIVSESFDLSILAIPYSIGGFIVGGIDEMAFVDRLSNTSNIFRDYMHVKLPNTITRIGDFAFSGCENIRQIEIPYGVSHIGEGVFVNCLNLIKIKMPDNIKTIGVDAFRNCRRLEDFYIPDTVRSISIEAQAFYSCAALKTINIPDSVTSINTAAFDNRYTTIICSEESYAKTWAEENDYPYKLTMDERIKTKSDKTTILTSDETTPTRILNHNEEMRYGAVESITLNFPEEKPDDYISSVIFTSGETATSFTAEGIIMCGDECEDGVFTPEANKRYTVIVSYDGVNIIGDVRGVSI